MAVESGWKLVQPEEAEHGDNLPRKCLWSFALERRISPVKAKQRLVQQIIWATGHGQRFIVVENSEKGHH